jgi:hypothetical protein
MDTNKDGLIDADVRRKMDLARVLLEEDKWQVEKEERKTAMQGAQNEQEALRQMLTQKPEQPIQ